MKKLAPSATLCFENAAGRVSDEAAGFLRLEWAPGVRSQTDFRALMTQMMRAMLRSGHGKALILQGTTFSYSLEEQTWILEYWLPRMAQDAGYRYGALVLAKNVLARLATTGLVTSARTLPITYQTFEDEAYAVSWLVQQPGRASG